MSSAIHVSDPAIAANLKKVLSVLHSKKKHKGVDAMLLRLYEPILWRSLNVANPLVRRNAASVFLEAFPLQDPDSNQQETDELMQKQFSALETLLYDESVAVRCAVIPGVFRMLNLYWELIPEQTIRVLLAHLFNDLAHDAASSAVRTAVLEGFKYLLDNHLAQPILKGISIQDQIVEIVLDINVNTIAAWSGCYSADIDVQYNLNNFYNFPLLTPFSFIARLRTFTSRQR
jgi:condensin-2 complex subunit G2